MDKRLERLEILIIDAATLAGYGYLTQLWGGSNDPKMSIEDKIIKWNQSLLNESIKSAVTKCGDIGDRETIMAIYDSKKVEVSKWIKEVGIEGIAALFLEHTNKKFNESFKISKSVAPHQIFGITPQFVNTVVNKKYPILEDMNYREVSETIYAVLFHKLCGINISFDTKLFGSIQVNIVSSVPAPAVFGTIATPVANFSDLTATSSSSKRRRISDMLVMQQI